MVQKNVQFSDEDAKLIVNFEVFVATSEEYGTLKSVKNVYVFDKRGLWVDFHQASRPQKRHEINFLRCIWWVGKDYKNAAIFHVEYGAKVLFQQVGVVGLELKAKTFPSKNRRQEASFDRIRHF